MFFIRLYSFKTSLLTIIAALTIAAIAGQPLAAAAEEKTAEKFQSILQDSLIALWTGREFPVELKQRQQAMKAMLSNGTITTAVLESMIEKTAMPLLNRYQTSRYVLNDVSERFNPLFSPHMAWEAAKIIIWRAATSPLQNKEPMVLTVGTLAPPGTPWMNVPENIIFPRIKKLTGGKVLIKIYGGGVMGDDLDVLEKMKDGQLDSCGCTVIGMLEASSVSSVLSLPGLFKNYEEVDFILKTFRKTLDRAFEENGYILCALVDTGNLYWFSVNRVSGLADLKKEKILMLYNDIEPPFYQALGISNVTSVSMDDVISFFRPGQEIVNLSPPAYMLGMQTYQYTNFYLKPSVFYVPGSVLVSSSIRARLRKDIGVSDTCAKNILEMFVSELNAVEPEWKEMIRRYEAKSLEAFETKCGIKAVTLSPEDQQAIETAGRAVERKLAGKQFPKDLIDNIRKALSDYRETRATR